MEKVIKIGAKAVWMQGGVRENGITTMHDATECGVWGGLYELAQAAGLSVRVEKEQIVVEDCITEICSYFGIDPYASISEGTLIIACREHKAQEVVKALSRKNIKSSIVGGIDRAGEGNGSGGRWKGEKT